MWVTRDKTGELHMFMEKPIRHTFYWSIHKDLYKSIIKLNPEKFPDLSWEDEPIEVELTIKNKQIIYDTKR